jgi:hypothetical protein
MFEAAKADTGSLSAKAQAEHAAAANPPSSIQTPSTPIDRTKANKVAGDDLTDAGAMGADQGSLGVFHHDFDGKPGVMKVFSAVRSTHKEAFARELSAARAASQTGYVRFLGEFDATHAVGDDLVPARAIGYDWQPGKSLDKLYEIGGEARIKPHTIDQVKDFVRRMAERGYVMGGDFQYLVDINGNVRPMDLETFTPLPPPGPARDQKLVDAAGWLGREIERLKAMMGVTVD